MASFLVLSGLLVVSTLFPGAAVGWPAIDSSLAAAAALGALAGLRLSDGTGRLLNSQPKESSWTMPRIESLPPPPASWARTLGLVVLRAYLLLAAAAVAVKVIRLIAGS